MTSRRLAERLYCRRLFNTHLPDPDVGQKKVLTTGGAAREAPHHGDLTNVRKGIGNRPLKQRLNRGIKRFVGGKIGVESVQRSKKPLLFPDPAMRLRGMPFFTALDGREGPVEKITHVGQDLHRLSPGSGELGKALGRAFKGARGTVGEGGYSVAEQFALLVHARTSYSMRKSNGCKRLGIHAFL
jgi:hypothetical protein